MSRRELTMPKLSDSMADAVIVRWLKSPGESFARGDALIEVETDKATVVYEAEQDGVLGDILVEEGGTADLGAAIARLVVGEAAPAEPVAAPPPRSAGARPRATPVARSLAGQLGVSLLRRFTSQTADLVDLGVGEAGQLAEATSQTPSAKAAPGATQRKPRIFTLGEE